MAWKSNTFPKSDNPQTTQTSDVKRVTKDAIEDVLRRAKELSSDSKNKLDQIKDPRLKRSAKR
jgi:hypothetical protein